MDWSGTNQKTRFIILKIIRIIWQTKNGEGLNNYRGSLKEYLLVTSLRWDVCNLLYNHGLPYSYACTIDKIRLYNYAEY